MGALPTSACKAHTRVCIDGDHRLKLCVLKPISLQTSLVQAREQKEAALQSMTQKIEAWSEAAAKKEAILRQQLQERDKLLQELQGMERVQALNTATVRLETLQACICAALAESRNLQA